MKFFLLFSLLIGTPVFAGEFILTVKDESVIKIDLKEPAIDLLTPYGRLKIPVTEIREIKFGHRVSDELKTKIENSISDLSGNDFAARDRATKFLMDNRVSSYHILKTVKNANTEFEARKKLILTFLEKELSYYELTLPKTDIIIAKEFTVVGLILNKEFLYESQFLGKGTIGLENIKTIAAFVNTKMDFPLDAGANTNEWFDTGIDLNKQSRISIKAYGSIDLFPGTPGQYVTGPNGYSQNGKNTAFPAGAVYGRLNNDLPFLIGERKNISSSEGRLYLRIAPSPWDNASMGSFNISIRND